MEINIEVYIYDYSSAIYDVILQKGITLITKVKFVKSVFKNLIHFNIDNYFNIKNIKVIKKGRVYELEFTFENINYEEVIQLIQEVMNKKLHEDMVDIVNSLLNVLNTILSDDLKKKRCTELV